MNSNGLVASASATLQAELSSLAANTGASRQQRSPASDLEELALLAAAVAATPMALVLLADPARPRCYAQIGSSGFELPRDSSFYQLALQAPAGLEVPDAPKDARFKDDSLILSGSGIRFCVGLALRSRSGDCLGVLCLFDWVPRELRPEQRDALAILNRRLSEAIEISRSTAAGAPKDASREAMLVALRRAAEAGDFQLHYQPKVDLRANRIVGLEALIRWRPVESGFISPNVFVPLLEESGLILPVGSWVMEQAMNDYRHWLQKGVRVPAIAVNVSPVQLADGAFVSEFERVIGSSGARQAPLDIEITEGMLLEKTGATIRKLNAIRGLGARIAIDDFGTGYSSLRYLVHLPIDALKIDRSFIASMADDADDMAIVSSVIALAHGLDLDVIAEGVETAEQRKLLRLLRCDQMQGYLYSPAADKSRIEELLIAESNAATHRHKALNDEHPDVALEERRRQRSRR